MLITRRTGSKVVAATVLGLVGWAGAAFACSPQPQVYSLLPGVAAPGETVQVEGRSVTGAAPVEIRWNGVGGQLLAVATPVGGAVSVAVQVPDVAPGIYSLTLVNPDVGVGRTAIEVTGEAGAAAAVSSAGLWPTAVDGALAPAAVSSTPGVAGLLLLGAGLVGLFGASTVVVVRRRLVPSRSR